MKLAHLGAAAVLLLAACTPSSGEDSDTGSEARDAGFDFYVLSLGWSPTFCLLQDPDGKSRQCAADSDIGLMVHGLWPQFEHGYPESCASEESQYVPDETVSAMLDLMPSAGLIGHQWRKHGTCSGISQRDYFDRTRQAFERIVLPPSLAADRRSKRSPQEVERAFIDANPGMGAAGIAVTCEAGMLEDVRICLTPDLAFRDCPRVDARSCRARTVDLPAAP